MFLDGRFAIKSNADVAKNDEKLTYRRKSGLDVYGAATSFIFSIIMAVMKIQMILTMVKLPDTMPQMKNSVGT